MVTPHLCGPDLRGTWIEVRIKRSSSCLAEYESAHCVKYSVGYLDTSGTVFYPEKTDDYCKGTVPRSLS